jgi:hypothetical protein
VKPHVLAGGEQHGDGVASEAPYAFLIDAHGVTNSAKGTFVLTPLEGSNAAVASAKVTCLKISGSHAIVSGVLTSPGSSKGTIAVADITNAPNIADVQLRFSFDPFVSADDLPGCYVPDLDPAGNVIAAGIQIVG